MTAVAVLDFADSEVASVTAEAGTLVLHLAAAQVEQAGETGYLLGVQARFDGAQWQGHPAACFGRIHHAQLSLGGARLAHLGLPFTGATVQAAFVFQNGEQLQVHAKTLHIDPQGARFVPSYAC